MSFHQHKLDPWAAINPNACGPVAKPISYEPTTGPSNDGTAFGDRPEKDQYANAGIPRPTGADAQQRTTGVGFGPHAVV
jgi:hypothetical protein